VYPLFLLSGSLLVRSDIHQARMGIEAREQKAEGGKQKKVM
jgi:hypothetical protein